MSVPYLQGLFAVKQNDFGTLREASDFSGDFDLRKFDLKFRDGYLKKFTSKEQAYNFLKRDIEFHLKAIRSQNEISDKRFLHGILIDFDAQKISESKKGLRPESLIGYFLNEELDAVVKENFFQSLGDIEVKRFLAYKKTDLTKDFILPKPLFDFKKKLLMTYRFRFIGYYVEIENLIERGEAAALKQRLPFDSAKIVNKIRRFDLELMKLYLPLFLTKGSIFLSDPYEFVFMYLKTRIMLWKALNPYLI